MASYLYKYCYVMMLKYLRFLYINKTKNVHVYVKNYFLKRFLVVI